MSLVSNERKKAAAIFSSIFCVILGVFALLLVPSFYARIHHLETSGLRASGEVIDLQVEPGGKTTVYRPIVSFKTKNEVSIKFIDLVGVTPPRHNRGERVNVLYDPDKPVDAIIDEGYWWNMEWVGILFLLIVLSAIFFVRSILRWRRTET
jgi:hypothetical protein